MGIEYYDHICPKCNVQLNSENYFQPDEIKDREAREGQPKNVFSKAWRFWKNITYKPYPRRLGQNGICNDCNWEWFMRMRVG